MPLQKILEAPTDRLNTCFVGASFHIKRVELSENDAKRTGVKVNNILRKRKSRSVCRRYSSELVYAL